MTSAIHPERQRHRWLIWTARIAFAIAAPLLLLALIEGALRLFNVGYSTSLMEPCRIQGQPASCYNLFFSAPFFPPGMIKAPQFFTVPAKKAPNTFRIVILGESAAMGDPDYAYGFGRYLEVMLRSRFSGMKFEVINTGMVAINSHVSRVIAREIADYQPELFIVYAGSNEVIGPYGPGSVLTSSSLSLPVIHASIFANSTRIGQLLARGDKPRSQWQGMEMFLDRKVRADSPRMKPAYNNFAANLQDIVSAGNKAGAHVILSTVATNLRDSSPFASLHRENITPEQLQTWDALVQKGITQENASACADALEQYAEAAQIDDAYADLHFRMARCLTMTGNLAAAKDHYVRARDLDALRFRADSRINDTIRYIAQSSGKSATLADTEALFSANSRNAIIGNELMYDHVHLTPLGSYLMARSLFQQIVPLLSAIVVQAAATTEPPTQAEAEKLLAFTNFDRTRVAGEMVDRLQRPPFTTQITHNEQVQNMMLRASSNTETPEGTFNQYRWALTQAPYDQTLHSKFGYFLFNFNKQAAAQEFMLARPNDDFPVYLPDGSRIQ